MESSQQVFSSFATYQTLEQGLNSLNHVFPVDSNSIYLSNSQHGNLMLNEAAETFFAESLNPAPIFSEFGADWGLFKGLEESQTGSSFLDLHSLSPDSTYAMGKAVRDDLTGLSAGQGMTGLSVNGIQHYQGSLRADAFKFVYGNAVSIYSGNGNIDFGAGFADLLDLSSISVSAVAKWNPADAISGGKVVNLGNGVRVFDELVLSDGSTILMEGLDGLLFQEGFYHLNEGFLPNDPLFNSQWNLHMMGVHNAWRFTQGSDNILLGVQDTGLGVSNWGYFHADIDPSRTFGIQSNLGDDFSGDQIGETSHGTGVQGIMAATSNNGIGLSGINWYSDVVNLDVLGGEINDYDLDLATQLMTDYARDTGRRVVINMSLGAHGLPPGAMPAFEQLIARNMENALFVVAAGNEDSWMLSYPANLANSYGNVIAVGASWGTRDWNGGMTNPGERISYSGWWGSNFGQGLSLMGPSEVISTRAANEWWDLNFSYHLNTPQSSYFEPFNGTSAAAPNVAGVASLVWSANPFLSATQVHGILANTAFDLGSFGYDHEYGNGFVNADAAVRTAIALARIGGLPQSSADAVWSTLFASTSQVQSEWGGVMRSLADMEFAPAIGLPGGLQMLTLVSESGSGFETGLGYAQEETATAPATPDLISRMFAEANTPLSLGTQLSAELAMLMNRADEFLMETPAAEDLWQGDRAPLLKEVLQPEVLATLA
jgi:subtilisin family serine protease